MTAFDPSDVLDLSTDNSVRANTLKTELTKDESQAPISVPAWDDLPAIPSGEIKPVNLPDSLVPSLSDVTVGSGSVTGTGSFDLFMQAVKAHLADMKEKGTLNDSAISEILSQSIPGILQQGVEWALQRPQIAAQAAIAEQQAQSAYWASISAREQAYATQAEAYTARVQAQVALAELQLQLANVGLTKMKILESNEQCNLLKIQGEAANSQVSDTMSNGQPVGGSIARDNAIKDQQVLNLEEQIKVQEEQIRLYQFQEKAYDLDGKIKVASIWSANYQTLIANGTLDEVPDCLNLDNTNSIFSKLAGAGGLSGHAGIDGSDATVIP